MRLTEKQLQYPLSDPFSYKNELSIAQTLEQTISYDDSVKITDFFSNKREIDHFINSYKFSYKLMSNNGESYYFDEQSYFVYKLITYRFHWIDDYLNFMHKKGLTFSINIELEISTDVQKEESIISLFEEKQEISLKKYIEKEKIPIQNEDDLNLCIKCLSFLFKNKELKYGFSDGAMYRMYYSDNVLGNINYSSLVKYIHNQISKDEIDLTQFFNEFEESHLILNQNYEYGSNNYKILYELLNFCFSYS